MIFTDRRDAGRRLANQLGQYASPDTIILAVPRGGVVVGFEVAMALCAKLDVVIPRKIGAPQQPELGIGAVAGDDVSVLDLQSIRYLEVSDRYLEEEMQRQREEIVRRRRVYRDDAPFPDLSGKIVILVDDGIATGYTIRAAAREIRAHRPSKLILAVPVAPPETVYNLKEEVDELIVLETPTPFFAVGAWYEHFDQTTDQEVIDLLRLASERKEAA